MEFYQLACSFGVHPGSDRTYVTLDGLAENMPKAMALFEELLADAQVNKEAYENLASDMLKKRVDAKLNQGQNFNRLIQYAIWGPKSPTTNVLTTAELQGLIERTQFAISTEETRYNLNGIYLHEKKGETPVLKAAATDGHRLATAEVALPKGAEGMPGVIIPRKTIGELTKLIAETAQDVTIWVSENQIRFSFGDVILSSRLIDGTYPDYDKVVPQGNDKFLEVDSAALTTVVDRVAVISEKSRGIKLSLKKGALVVSATSSDEGMAEDELEAGYDADSLEIGFNYRYLLDILAQVKGGTVRFSLLDGTSPVVIQDANDPSALYVLMPMRV